MVQQALHAEEYYAVILFADGFPKRASSTAGCGLEGSFAGNGSSAGVSVFGSVSGVPMSMGGLGRKERRV